jgi:hypothetical protein
MSYGLVRQAILEKRVIHATYSGLHREMCPQSVSAGVKIDHIAAR